MRVPLLPLAIVTAMLIAAGVAIALVFGSSGGGGGGSQDTSTLDGYFQALSTTQQSISSDFSTISAKYPNAGTDVEETVAYLKESRTALADGVDKLNAIKPPAAAAQQHAALVKAAQDIEGYYADLQSGAENATSAADLQTLISSSSTQALDDFTSACTALQDLATQNDIATNMSC